MLLANDNSMKVMHCVLVVVVFFSFRHSDSKSSICFFVRDFFALPYVACVATMEELPSLTTATTPFDADAASAGDIDYSSPSMAFSMS